MKRCGATCIVQDPNQAEYPDMPMSVINNVEVDYVVALDEIGPLIGKVLKSEKGRKKPVPKKVLLESRIAGLTAVSNNDV